MNWLGFKIRYFHSFNCFVLGSIQAKLEPFIRKGDSQWTQSMCLSCGYSSRYIDVERHVESKHLDLELACPFSCDPNDVKPKLTSRLALKTHLRKYHGQDKLQIRSLMALQGYE